ncbi:glycosyltransferase family 2 protein [Collimonas silvisoli]|uniref:glycosyltransferase family 2 protein n=1 Tax=Collimonas silvisoli TaxID=2825884 RepID=UPI001B8CD18D|nr:glycosyltransferase family A protein [Collimonas silvisoli]
MNKPLLPPPLVSVIVPVYNGCEFLDDCLRSMLNQSFTDAEIIVVNDGSTDETPALLKQYENHKNIVVCHFSENRGEAAATNVGIQIAKGKYIARMDADDISLPERLSLQVRMHKRLSRPQKLATLQVRDQSLSYLRVSLTL